MKLKKVAGLLLAVGLGVSALSGCAKKAEAPAESPAKTESAAAQSSAKTEESKTEGAKPEETTGGNTAIGNGKKIVVVFNTNLGDKSFSDLVWSGVQKAATDYGVEVKAIELMGDATKQEPTLEELCDSGEWDLIVAGTFNLKEAIMKVADEYPDQKFLVYDTELDYSSGKYQNCHSVMCKQNEGAFLGGALAAMMTVSGDEGFNADDTIGFVGGGENSAINDFLVGYIQGAKYVDPNCKVLFSYIGDFKNTAKAKELAIAQYNQGADIVFQVAASAGLGVLDAAEQENKYAIGVDQDQAALIGETDPAMAAHIMTSVVKNLDILIYNEIGDYLKGQLAWGVHENAGLKENGMALADNQYLRAIVPEDTLKKVDEIKQKVIDGEITVESAIGMSTEQVTAIKDKAE